MEILNRAGEFLNNQVEKRVFRYKVSLDEATDDQLLRMVELYEEKLRVEEALVKDSRDVAILTTTIGAPVTLVSGINSFLIPSIVCLGFGLYSELKVGYAELRYKRIKEKVKTS
ncbi:MAG: hypothetical protein ACD_30C00022G0010 [uncultured bacterium]|uniref:Uncharacterized protein n=3 Tax=Candidatus Daviesiibacteriota TaxID=1752718 RepID=A0A0G0HW06_9BACT|nr:MAG: hypothetical protein ACD_30C00022G0010 [uncultured bacterium]KKQ08066.1 MAG: hypothetical protein US19_C0032G0010 [Candidatus Daviesbacteria bacterium GW2011_GWB1_36_5]KKQ16255.1 MAG: hypothetical protein US28_C0003G0019 [Candidatus Daviesbacteria bacterium GW2011_GWA1_36_8]OGE33123.1 MAG: hypothetical protein A3C99_03800 [Candidatus Daviesbacteria bacterium RIFCSPHIGHO2_02_FULL_37_9]OGE36721.1 MAG: hypothetical protein A3E66_02200 [Candidatus Daviesbacteria bacterium RIFCSPHIGHO2_12_FU